MNSLSRSSGGMPGPSSATMIRTRPFRRVVLRLDDDLAALVERLDRVVDEVDDRRGGSGRDPAGPGAATRRTASRCARPRRGRRRAPAWSASSSCRSVGTRRGAGMRANCENSSTSAFSDSTSPTIVAVHSSTSARTFGGRRGELALQPLRAQLDRRQRVLDLVREPPRHLAPGRDLLGADERRDVVEARARGPRPGRPRRAAASPRPRAALRDRRGSARFPAPADSPVTDAGAERQLRQRLRARAGEHGGGRLPDRRPASRPSSRAAAGLSRRRGRPRRS